MKNKLEQVNQSYKKALARVLLKEFPDLVELVVTDVLIDPSYQHGRVWLRTTAEILHQVERKRPEIQAQMTKYVKTHYTPRLNFLLDEGDMDKIEDLFGQIRSS